MDEEYAKYLIEKGRDDYNKIAQHFIETRFHLWPDFEIFKKYFKNGDTALDAGCGNGRLSEIFKKSKIHYIGLDSSEKLIAAAKVKYPEQKFMVADILDLPFEEKKFEVVFLIAVLQHVPSKEWRLKALDNLHWVLKKEGFLLMTNWNLWQRQFFSLRLKYNILKILGRSELDFHDIFKSWKSPEEKVITERYLHAFTLKEIEDLMKETRFKLIKNYYSLRGEEAGKSSAYNIITIAQKAWKGITLLALLRSGLLMGLMGIE